MLKLWKWYQNSLAVHPVKTQVISSAIIWGVGDIAAQTITYSTAKNKHQIQVNNHKEYPIVLSHFYIFLIKKEKKKKMTLLFFSLFWQMGFSHFASISSFCHSFFVYMYACVYIHCLANWVSVVFLLSELISFFWDSLFLFAVCNWLVVVVVHFIPLRCSGLWGSNGEMKKVHIVKRFQWITDGILCLNCRLQEAKSGAFGMYSTGLLSSGFKRLSTQRNFPH